MSSDLRQKLDRIIQILWSSGVLISISYVEQLACLIFLKMLDEEDRHERGRWLLGEQTRRERIYAGDAERFRWSEWKLKPVEKLHDFVRDDVFPYMASLVEEAPRIAGYFRDATLALPHRVLKEVVGIIDTIQFSELGADIKGDVIEHLLSHTKGQGEVGQFRTPRQIRRLMVALVDPGLGDTIYDPCCGSGGLLVDAVEHILAKHSASPVEVPIYGEDWLEQRGFSTVAEAKAAIPALQTYRKGNGDRLLDWDLLERSVFGVDVSSSMMRIATMNLFLHGIKNAKIKRGNPISDLGGFGEGDSHGQYKVILSNPPLVGTVPQDSIRRDLAMHSKKGDILFLALMMYSLAPGGRCAVVVPDGLLFGSTAAHVELRRRLIEDFDVLAVVTLPCGVFRPYSGVRTSILVFRRPEEHASRRAFGERKIWFYEVDNDGYDPNRTSAGSRVETPEKNRIPDLLGRWSAYKASDFENPPGHGHDELLEASEDEPRCWWASAAFVLESEANLSVGRYRPRQKTKMTDDDPLELIDRIMESCAVEQEGLRRLRSRLADLAEDR